MTFRALYSAVTIGHKEPKTLVRLENQIRIRERFQTRILHKDLGKMSINCTLIVTVLKETSLL